MKRKTPARPGHPSRSRFARPAIAIAAALILALALPPLASATTRTLTVQKAGSGAGTVTSSPAGISCGVTCSAPFTQDAAVTLSAAAASGSQPVQWSGCTSVISENKCQVTMSGAKSVTASFELIKRQLTVSVNGTGSGTVTSSPVGIWCGATCAAGFLPGATVTLSGAPGADTLAVKWAGCDSVDAEGRCLVAMSAARSVSANFGIEGPQLTVSKTTAGAAGGAVIGPAAGTITSSPAGIECGATCSQTFLQGATVTLSGAPGLHTEAVQWSGCDSVNGEDKCLVTISAARAVTATYKPAPGLTLFRVALEKTGTGAGTITSSPAGIECGSACSAEVLTATTLTLTASPAEGSVFAHWSGGGCAGSGPCTTTVKSSKTVKAVFTAVGTRTLTVTKAGTGTGTVTGKAAGIDCGETCSAQVPAGKKVTLSAKAAPGSAFAHWSGACAGAGTCTVTMTEARDVTASFSAPPPPPCLVPRLAGKTPSKARAALAAAHCVLGKVSKPKARKGTKLGPLVVKSSSPGAGVTLPAGGKVDLRLRRAAKKHGRAHKRRYG